MRAKELQDYLNENPVVEPNTPRTRTLIVVGDSKSCRLQNIVQNIEPEKSIVWRCKGGRNSVQAANYIIDNLDYFVETYGQILLLVWTGTCDLTEFQSVSKSNLQNQPTPRRCINLSHNTVGDILVQYRRIIVAVQKYGSKVQLAFLEVPQYSICIWNKCKGDQHFENYKTNTDTLNIQIEQLNESIRDINRTSGIRVPLFGIDLYKSKKSNPGHKSYKFSWSLLSDGIHAIPLLSRYWLRRIVLTICPRCYK